MSGIYDQQAMIDLRLQGMLVKDIAAQIGCSKSAVMYVLGKNGLTKEALENGTWIDKGKIGALRRAGWSALAISVDMYLPIETVEKAIKEMNL